MVVGNGPILRGLDLFKQFVETNFRALDAGFKLVREKRPVRVLPEQVEVWINIASGHLRKDRESLKSTCAML